MPYNLEIEFKNLLNKQDFYRLCTMFKIGTQDFTLQKNYYYDTDEVLADKLMALRIRQRAGVTLITLKQKAVQSKHAQIEITEPFTATINELLTNPHSVLPKPINNHLAMEQVVLTELTCIGHIETLRKELDYQGGTLCLDYSRFNSNQIDYELEFEFDSINDGETIFDNFLLQHNIQRKPAKNKVSRMLKYDEEVVEEL